MALFAEVSGFPRRHPLHTLCADRGTGQQANNDACDGLDDHDEHKNVHLLYLLFLKTFDATGQISATQQPDTNSFMDIFQQISRRMRKLMLST